MTHYAIKRLLRVPMCFRVDRDLMLGLLRLELARARLMGNEDRARILSQAKESVKRNCPKKCACGTVIAPKSQRCKLCSNRERYSRGTIQSFISPFERPPVLA